MAPKGAVLYVLQAVRSSREIASGRCQHKTVCFAMLTQSKLSRKLDLPNRQVASTSLLTAMLRRPNRHPTKRWEANALPVMSLSPASPAALPPVRRHRNHCNASRSIHAGLSPTHKIIKA